MITTEKRDKIDIVSFNIRKLDALVTERVREDINKLFVNPNARVVLDLRGVEYIDSSGFGCFLSALRAARNNYGTVKIANPEPRILTLFHTLQLDTVFDIVPDLDECIRSLR